MIQTGWIGRPARFRPQAPAAGAAAGNAAVGSCRSQQTRTALVPHMRQRCEASGVYDRASCRGSNAANALVKWSQMASTSGFSPKSDAHFDRQSSDAAGRACAIVIASCGCIFGTTLPPPPPPNINTRRRASPPLVAAGAALRRRLYRRLCGRGCSCTACGGKSRPALPRFLRQAPLLLSRAAPPTGHCACCRGHKCASDCRNSGPGCLRTYIAPPRPGT